MLFFPSTKVAVAVAVMIDLDAFVLITSVVNPNAQTYIRRPKDLIRFSELIYRVILVVVEVFSIVLR